METFLRELHRKAVNGCQESKERIRRFSPPRVWNKLKPCIALSDNKALVTIFVCGHAPHRHLLNYVGFTRSIYFLRNGNARLQIAGSVMLH